ncbi:MAG: ABC transporter ATP-binding protein/permease [Deltaproteobacteria bacterium]|nr:ABC transporter ATP-binding protein/permease [Deltaproteobacteria bacterium]
MGLLIAPQRLPGLFYRAFIHDALRIYRILPAALKTSVFLVLGLQVVAAVVETLTLLVLSFFALTMAAPLDTANHYLLKPIINFFPKLAPIFANPRDLVILACLMMVVFVIVKSALALLATQRATILAQKISLALGALAMADYLAQDYETHLLTESQSAIHSVLNRDRLSLFVMYNFLFYANLTNCLFLFLTLALIEPRLTLIVVLAFGLAALIVYGAVKKRLDVRSAENQNYVIKEGQELVALSQGVREILIYGREESALKRIVALAKLALKAKAEVNFFAYVPSQALETAGFVTIGAVVCLMIFSGLPLASVVASTSILMLTAWRILPAVSRCLAFTVNIRSYRAPTLAILTMAENRATACPPAKPDPNFAFNGELVFQKATYTYPKATKTAINDLDLRLSKGQSLGLIGLSGSGKSTLALAFTGLITPQKGQFLVDGQPLSPARRAAYYRILGYVPQNPLLIEGTLADNVAFGLFGEAIDQDQLLLASREAALDFVQSHPLGLDQPLAPGSISGGQAQRVAIARALYPRPKIVIFDEATSALDQASENIIKNTLDRLKGQITAIIVAHRLTTVEKCDLVAWVDAGSIRLLGPPHEVIPIYEETIDQMALIAKNQLENMARP